MPRGSRDRQRGVVVPGLCAPEPSRHDHKPGERDKRQRRPQEESVLGRGQDAPGVRREPVHLPADEPGGSDTPVQGEICRGLRQEAHAACERGAGSRAERRPQPLLRILQHSHRQIDGGRGEECHILLAHHHHEGAGGAERESARERPPLAHVQPHHDEERDREGRCGMRHRWREVRIEEERRADPDGERRKNALRRCRALLFPPHGLTTAMPRCHRSRTRSTPPRHTARHSHREGPPIRRPAPAALRHRRRRRTAPTAAPTPRLRS